ncbi:hypothetical protein ACVWWQ_003078 [Rhodanobacter sp. TND4EL1]
MNSRKNFNTMPLQRTALALALGLGFTGLAFGQATTGSIFGQAPATSGETVTVSGSTGITREVAVDSAGRYRVSNLPLGTYTVTLKKDGVAVESRDNIAIVVGAGTTVSFAGAQNAQNLEAVTVQANALPVIDVSSVDARTVITAEELAKLPIGRNAEAIALLSPGAVSGNGAFGRTVSFGGAGVTENAYYINGYNTTDPLKALGGVGLPYGSIDQQETYTGGYSAMYGRSDGGVISQVGKRGTNEWHFGAQVTWAPRALANDPENIYYPDGQPPAGFVYNNPTLPGTIYRNRKNNTSWDTTYSAYVGGPLISDRLYMFVAAEAEKQEGSSTSTSAAGAPNVNQYKYSRPKLYTKLDWNINDSNILEYTHIQSNESYAGDLYDYDYATGTHSQEISGHPTSTKDASKFDIGKYTGYLTDDLTLSVTYGKSKTVNFTEIPGLSATLPFLSGVTNQDPAITGGTPIRNGVAAYATTTPDAGSKTRGLRADLEYQLGDHHLALGIDNQSYFAHNQGQDMGGPGYIWIYSKAGVPTKAVNPALGVGAPGGNGYYVQKYIFKTTTSMSVKQKAFYLEDKWQVSDNVLLSLGVRNDHFTNYNSAAKPYVDQKNQWAPRLGASWDVFGDQSFKVYGNLGRYFLALPNSVAIRGASASTYTREYFTYTGIDAEGNPTGLGAMGPGPVSANGEYGVAPDNKTFGPTDLKSQYQDEAILGFDKTLGSDWAYGAKATYRKLQSAIDDVCDSDKIYDKLDKQGIDSSALDVHGCYIFNPGRTNTFLLNDLANGGYKSVQMSQADWGFNQGAKRKYYALDMYLEHPFNNGWQARVDYTFSRSWGNTEGQVRSDLGQDDVSKTEDWDAAEIMIGSGGLLANNRRHQLKMRGSYQITPEWLVSAALRVQSGSPKNCLGYFGPNQTDPIGYKGDYHYCFGKVSGNGSAGNTPWTEKVDLGVIYRPAFAENKLGIALNVFNVLNQRRAIATDPRSSTDVSTLSNTYGMGTYYSSPRYVRMSVSYDY